MEIQYDDWQQEILDYQGDIILLKGRRIGGTEIFSIKAAERMMSQPGVKIVFISLTEDQAKLCISVALDHLTRKYKKSIKKEQVGMIELKNGSIMRVRPVGNTGNAVRGFDGDVLGIDEAPWQPKMMWKAARPIISTNDGEIWMWGTPYLAEGYFHEQFDKAYVKKDPEARFKVWYKTSEEVLFNRPISPSWTEKQARGAIRVLGEEKKDMSEEEYGNEYLGQFLSDMRRLYDDEWIEKVCKLPSTNYDPHTYQKALGVDIAGMGDDISSFDGLYRKGVMVKQFHHETTKKTDPVQTENKIKDLEAMYKFWKIGLDDGGMGVGVLAHLLRYPQTRFKVIGLNNSRRVYDIDEHSKLLYEEAMYINLLHMGLKGELLLFDDPEIKAALRSIICKENGHFKGRFDHIVEAIMRAAYLLKDKDLKPWMSSFPL